MDPQNVTVRQKTWAFNTNCLHISFLVRSSIILSYYKQAFLFRTHSWQLRLHFTSAKKLGKSHLSKGQHLYRYKTRVTRTPNVINKTQHWIFFRGARVSLFPLIIMMLFITKPLGWLKYRGFENLFSKRKSNEALWNVRNYIRNEMIDIRLYQFHLKYLGIPQRWKESASTVH